MNNKIEEQPQEGEMRIEVAGPEEIDEKDLNDLVKNLISSTFQPEQVIAEETRMRIRDRITPLKDKISRFSKPIERLLEKMQHTAYPGYTRSDHFNGNLRSIKEMMKAGQLFACIIDNRTVGITAYRSKIKTPDGRDIYEITKASTLKEFQGRGIFSKLAKFAFERIRETYPNSPVIKVTANPAVKKTIEKMKGWKVIDLDADSEIAKAERALIPEPELKKMIEGGFQILYFDPQEK